MSSKYRIDVCGPGGEDPSLELRIIETNVPWRPEYISVIAAPGKTGIDVFIRSYVVFDTVTAEEFREVARWFQMAAATAETLEYYIKTVDDLRAPITARIVGKSVLIDKG